MSANPFPASHWLAKWWDRAPTAKGSGVSVEYERSQYPGGVTPAREQTRNPVSAARPWWEPPGPEQRTRDAMVDPMLLHAKSARTTFRRAPLKVGPPQPTIPRGWLAPGLARMLRGLTRPQD